MSTLGTMQTRIRSSLNRGSDHDAQIIEAIVSAIEFYKYKRFTFNTGRSTSSTTDGQEYMQLPTDWLEVDHVKVLYSSQWEEPLDEVTYRWIDFNLHTTNYKSVPEKFAIQDQQLRLWPIPDDSYRLTMAYLRDLTEISASATAGATNAWMTDGEELIRMRANADVLENTIGSPEAFAEADRKTQREVVVYNSLKRAANRQRSSGRVMPWL